MYVGSLPNIHVGEKCDVNPALYTSSGFKMFSVTSLSLQSYIFMAYTPSTRLEHNGDTQKALPHWAYLTSWYQCSIISVSNSLLYEQNLI